MVITEQQATVGQSVVSSAGMTGVITKVTKVANHSMQIVVVWENGYRGQHSRRDLSVDNQQGKGTQ